MPNKPPKAVNASTISITPMSLFPTLGSVQEVVELANSKLPVIQQNELYSLLMVYHNTLLKELENHKCR